MPKRTAAISLIGLIVLFLSLLFSAPLISVELAAPHALRALAMQPVYNLDVRVPNFSLAPSAPLYVTAYFETKTPISNPNWQQSSAELFSHSKPFVRSQWPEINRAFKEVKSADSSEFSGTLLSDPSGLKHVFVGSPMSFTAIALGELAGQDIAKASAAGGTSVDAPK